MCLASWPPPERTSREQNRATLDHAENTTLAPQIGSFLEGSHLCLFSEQDAASLQPSPLRCVFPISTKYRHYQVCSLASLLRLDCSPVICISADLVCPHQSAPHGAIGDSDRLVCSSVQLFDQIGVVGPDHHWPIGLVHTAGQSNPNSFVSYCVA
ncbi:hypothetical protein VTI28DRAFT_1336 [Corynascus sepedonium]